VKPLSIRLQLSLVMSLLTLVIIAVLSAAAYVEFKESLLDNVDATLMAVGEGIRAQLDEESPADFKAELRAIAGEDHPMYSSQYRVWLDGAARDLFTSDSPGNPLPRALLHPPVAKRPEVAGFSLLNLTDDSASGRVRAFRVLWMRQASDPQVVNILVARPSDQVYHELGEFLRLLLVFGGMVTVAALLLVPRIVAWGLRSISYAGRQLDQITHRNLGPENLAMSSVPVELQPFKAALDGMLVRLNKAVQQQKQLTADVTHELRTPLAVMKSTLQTLRMKPRTAVECEEGIDDALRDVARMEQLVAQLLTLARLDSVDEVAHPTDVRLDLLLQSVAEIFDNHAGQQGASVVCVNGAAVCVRGDENELRQLFGNLLDNALRYGPPHGVIRLRWEDGPGPWVTAQVHDEGGAIPPEHVARLFDRFYRVDASRSQTCGGAGLGLAIAHQIVQRHHGEIAITSDPHAGTLVTVRLPRK
jgi:two-component system heavy metal sensor histidine kinase CusS